MQNAVWSPTSSIEMDKVYMQLLFSLKKTSGQMAVLAGMALTCAMALSVAAQSAAPTAEVPFNERFDIDAIQSNDAADEALQAAGKQRTMLADRYIDDQRECYKKFFVSSCLEDAKERNRVSVKEVREVEAAANLYKRQAKADDRDHSLNEQRIKDEQDAVRRAKDQKSRTAAVVRKSKDGAAKQRSVAEREAQAQGHADDRVLAHQAKRRSEQAAEAAKAPQRAANERAYKQKAVAAEAHRKDVAAKKAAKEREIAAKKQPVPAATEAAPAK
jgi:colicin import membrane protein